MEWDSTCIEYRVSMENTSKRIWFWFNLPWTIQQWIVSNVFGKLSIRLLEVYDDLRGIGWKWQSLFDSVSVKSPLGGHE